MKDHPLNRNKQLLPFYAGKAVLVRAASGTDFDGRTEIHFNAYLIVAYTPCGAWITWGMSGAKDKFVNLKCDKQWASVTMDEAVEQLTRRKKMQVRILGAHLAHAEDALALLLTGSYSTGIFE